MVTEVNDVLYLFVHASLALDQHDASAVPRVSANFVAIRDQIGRRVAG